MDSARSIIVTGCGGGIGTVLVQRLLEAGWHVIGIDLADGGGAAHPRYEFMQVDLERLVNDQDFNDRFVAELTQRASFKPLAGLINNAATQIIGAAETMPLADFKRTIDVNLTAAFELSRICLAPLRANRGTIINVSSIHAKLSKKNFLAYSVSKAGLSALTKGMAIEFGETIRVCAIEPAAIETQMLRAGFGDDADKKHAALSAYHPSGTIGKPDDIADVAFFLLNNTAQFTNGMIIDLSGGISHVLSDPESL